MPAAAQTYKVLVTFNVQDGQNPIQGVVRDDAGNLYGTTTRGGDHNVGIIFRIAASGAAMKTLHDLDYSPDGALPYAGLVHDSILYTLMALARLHPETLSHDVFLRFGLRVLEGFEELR